MPDIQEAKCIEFTIQILPPPPRSFQGGGNFATPRFISVYSLESNASTNIYVPLLIKYSVKDKYTSTL